MTDEKPDVRFRRFIDEHYTLGLHHGRPVAVLKDGTEPIYLDDRGGLGAWRFEVMYHGHLASPMHWWRDLPILDVEELVKSMTSHLLAETRAHGSEIEALATDEDVLLADAADRHGWARAEFAKMFQGQAMVDAARDLVEERKTARAMAEANKEFGWIDLTKEWEIDPPLPVHLSRTDCFCGLYAAQRNLVVGYTESGKTWLELHAIAQEIRAGRPAVLLDCENGEAVIRTRLKALGLEQHQVHELLRYSFLSMPLSPEFAAEMAQELWADGARMVMVDALTPIASAMNLDLSGGNVNAVEQVYAAVLDPWVRAGFCAVMLDNTGKRDKSASSGSQHKEAGIGGSVLAVVAETKAARGRRGHSSVYVNKDRSGSVHTEVTAEDKRLFGTLHIDPVGTDGDVSVFIVPPPAPAVAIATAVATVVDIVTQTCELAAEGIRKMGLTEVRSMRRLADIMDVVRGGDPSLWPAAHTDRAHIANCLTKVASAADLSAAGLGVEAIGTTGGVRYRVWLT